MAIKMQLLSEVGWWGYKLGSQSFGVLDDLQFRWMHVRDFENEEALKLSSRRKWSATKAFHAHFVQKWKYKLIIFLWII